MGNKKITQSDVFPGKMTQTMLIHANLLNDLTNMQAVK